MAVESWQMERCPVDTEAILTFSSLCLTRPVSCSHMVKCRLTNPTRHVNNSAISYLHSVMRKTWLDISTLEQLLC